MPIYLLIMYNTFVIAILLSILARSIWSFPVLGDSCTLSNGEFGVCKLIDTCPIAIQLSEEGIYTEICSFQGDQPIICCSEEISGNIENGNTGTRMAKEGDSCTLNNGGSGVCKLIDTCPITSQLLEEGIYPKICSFQEEQPIICCSEEISGNIENANTGTRMAKERDSCTLNNGESGVYKLMDTCPITSQLLDVGIYSKICSFQGDKPIICCPEEKSADSCTLNNGESGVCKLMDTCPVAIQLLREQIYPEICSYQENQPIVCCPEEISGTIENDNTGTRIAKEKCQALIEPRRNSDGSVSFGAAGGQKTFVEEFPHMAALGYGNENDIKYLCGGSLISEQFVLTAAHCLYSKEHGDVKWVLLGALLLDDPKITNATRFAVKEVFEHPKYRPPSHYDDIALLKLEDKVVSSYRIHPACLYTEQTVPNKPLVATGWGKMSDSSGEGSNHLLKVKLEHVDSGSCNSTYSTFSTRKLKNGISKYTQICAGGTIGKDTCQGDSGGPLQFKIPLYGNTYEIVGITSFGKTCAVTNSPGVYTKVAGFLDWIESIVWNE